MAGLFDGTNPGKSFGPKNHAPKVTCANSLDFPPVQLSVHWFHRVTQHQWPAMTPGQDFMREHASDMRAGAVKSGAPSWSGEVDGFSKRLRAGWRTVLLLFYHIWSIYLFSNTVVYIIYLISIIYLSSYFIRIYLCTDTIFTYFACFYWFWSSCRRPPGVTEDDTPMLGRFLMRCGVEFGKTWAILHAKKRNIPGIYFGYHMGYKLQILIMNKTDSNYWYVNGILIGYNLVNDNGI